MFLNFDLMRKDLKGCIIRGRKGIKYKFYINGSDKISQFCSYVSPGGIENSRLT